MKDFRELDAPNLIINIWTYNDREFVLPCCTVCFIYSEWYTVTLKEKCQEEWGDFDFVVEKLKNNDRSFVDLENIRLRTDIK